MAGIKTTKIPTYSLGHFTLAGDTQASYRAEVFDANRHFGVIYPHSHDFYEILYLWHGSGYHTIDGNKYQIQPPCVFFLSPGQAHALSLSEDVAGYIFLFTGDYYLESKANQNQLLEFPFFFDFNRENPPLQLMEEDKDFIETLFKKAISETEDKTPAHGLVRSILDCMLMWCLKRYSIAASIEKPGSGHILAKKFLHALEENFSKNLSVSQYASILSVSANYLAQQVKAHTGATPSALSANRQVREAKRMLAHTDMQICNIAESLGFSEQSYFTKVFKNATGYKPLQYRNIRRI
jgi:AraC family transcriptional regulator, transcriptional activator of pobA